MGAKCRGKTEKIDRIMERPVCRRGEQMKGRERTMGERAREGESGRKWRVPSKKKTEAIFFLRKLQGKRLFICWWRVVMQQLPV